MSDSLGIKIHPPRWGSSKRDEWATFATDFESFVEFQGGEELVSIFQECVNPRSQDLLPTNNTPLAAGLDFFDASSGSGQVDDQPQDQEPPQSPQTQVVGSSASRRFQSLSAELRRLGADES